MPDLESRHYIQAWHFLRSNGETVPENLHKQLLGVVLEVAVENGCDFLAAYPERTARYYNFSGAGVIWERPSEQLDAAIARLLSVSQRVLNAIGPWDKPRRPAPTGDMVRLNFLSPAGLHFGEASFDVFGKDPMAAPVLQAGVVLMQQMISLKPPAK